MFGTQALQVVLVGSGPLLIECGERLLQRGHGISCVVDTGGTVTDWARRASVRCIPRGHDLAAELAAGPFDYLLSIANLQILPASVLALPRYAAINYHDGPLPAYIGRNVPSWALLNRERVHGITWHLMTESVDRGAVVVRRAFPIDDRETALSLSAKCHEVALESFDELLAALERRRVMASPQQGPPGRRYTRIDRPPGACTLDWHSDAETIDALVRALAFGGTANPLGVPKLVSAGDVLACTAVEVCASDSGGPPGRVVRVEDSGLQVTTGSRDVVVRGVRTLEGRSVNVADVATRYGLGEGSILPQLDAREWAQLSVLDADAARHEEFWIQRLAQPRSLELPYARSVLHAAERQPEQQDRIPLAPPALDAIRRLAPALSRSEVALAALGAYLVRASGLGPGDLGYGTVALRRQLGHFCPWFSPVVPVCVEAEGGTSFGQLLDELSRELDRARAQFTFTRDLVLRQPRLQARAGSASGGSDLHAAVLECERLAEPELPAGCVLALAIARDGSGAEWLFDRRALLAAEIERIDRQFATLVSALAGDPTQAIEDLPLLEPVDQALLIGRWAHAREAPPEPTCVHELFERQAKRTPGAVALAGRAESVTYAALDAWAAQLAIRLARVGVGRATLVGIHMRRSPAAVAAILGVWKAGGAYVPLDPTYPAERTRFVLGDAALQVVISDKPDAPELSGFAGRVVSASSEAQLDEAPGDSRPSSAAQDLAYVMYTSGSTGQPKGVIIEHRNVVNCFRGMDLLVPHDPPGVWLAVSSLSFDISVLELIYPLTHGFTVVVQDDVLRALSAGPAAAPAARPIEFSLFYFASDESQRDDLFRLLLEGARFADAHGFAAIWTPERHFHPFGGPFPNPSVTSAAIAAMTRRIAIRAGSVVLPLHDPLRIAEEWAVVDHLSNGRVGISFASGWQPDDFLLRPERYRDRRERLAEDVETVRRLWRGESITRVGPDGRPVEVRTHPRPVQPELPVWLTAAGSPATFELAGQLGANLLTHLLGQSLEELSEKLARYRRAWREAGHPDSGGHVTLMVHTFVGRDEMYVRRVVERPLKAYLSSATDLVKRHSAAFPAFRRPLPSGQAEAEFDALTDDELRVVVNHAFERYYGNNGLFGTVERCADMVARIRQIGVDEIACLIDFGVPADLALLGLQALDEVRRESSAPRGAAADSFAGLIHRYGVTHLQCTPTLARAILAQPDVRQAMSSLRAMLVGGEAVHPQLARELRALVPGVVLNVYGPTETTIWSVAHEVERVGETVPIGRPLLNTDVYVLDSAMRPLPVGLPGELYIGGQGVAHGYLHRAALTAERFLPHPFNADPSARVYRTGDIARYRPDGQLEWLGRRDGQVKTRGFRIELGEVEAALGRHPVIRQNAVIAREVNGELQLAAYVVLGGAPGPGGVDGLREWLAEHLPPQMLPSSIVAVPRLPLLPNGKVDRRALLARGTEPAPTLTGPSAGSERSSTQAVITGVWRDVLGLTDVPLNRSFFEIGGDSLSAVRVVMQLRAALKRDLPLAVFFGSPTVSALAELLDGAGIEA